MVEEAEACPCTPPEENHKMQTLIRTVSYTNTQPKPAKKCSKITHPEKPRWHIKNRSCHAGGLVIHPWKVHSFSTVCNVTFLKRGPSSNWCTVCLSEEPMASFLFTWDNSFSECNKRMGKKMERGKHDLDRTRHCKAMCSPDWWCPDKDWMDVVLFSWSSWIHSDVSRLWESPTVRSSMWCTDTDLFLIRVQQKQQPAWIIGWLTIRLFYSPSADLHHVCVQKGLRFSLGKKKKPAPKLSHQ